MSSEIVKTLSNKGGECVVVRGFKYCKGYVKDSNSKIVWRCSIRNCPALLVTNNSSTDIVESDDTCHVHPPVAGIADMQRARVSCKRKATDDIGSRPSKVMRACLKEVSTDNMTRADTKKLTRSIQDVRRSHYPKAPKDLIELHIAVDALHSVTTRNEQFVLVNDIPSHSVIFTCDSNLHILCRSDAEIFADGTFKCCVNLFEQLYVIHGCVNGHYMPLVFCLLMGKSEDLYKHVWSSIRDRCATLGLVFQPNCVNFDFEIAAINAMRQIFPAVPIYTCRFHYGQV